MKKFGSWQVFSPLISVEHPGAPTEHGQLRAAPAGRTGARCSSARADVATIGHPRPRGQRGPGQVLQNNAIFLILSVGTFRLIRSWELHFIRKSWGIRREEEGGHGLMFLLNGHLQASAWETPDLFECTRDGGSY